METEDLQQRIKNSNTKRLNKPEEEQLEETPN